MMKALVKFLGRNDMTAYLVMMGNRLVELHRVPEADRQPVFALQISSVIAEVNNEDFF
jgi:hypothetical protein